jgi:hypothetical protein
MVGPATFYPLPLFARTLLYTTALVRDDAGVQNSNVMNEVTA